MYYNRKTIGILNFPPLIQSQRIDWLSKKEQIFSSTCPTTIGSMKRISILCLTVRSSFFFDFDSIRWSNLLAPNLIKRRLSQHTVFKKISIVSGSRKRKLQWQSTKISEFLDCRQFIISKSQKFFFRFTIFIDSKFQSNRTIWCTNFYGILVSIHKITDKICKLICINIC